MECCLRLENVRVQVRSGKHEDKTPTPERNRPFESASIYDKHRKKGQHQKREKVSHDKIRKCMKYKKTKQNRVFQ
jgi:hypothetical protein